MDDNAGRVLLVIMSENGLCCECSCLWERRWVNVDFRMSVWWWWTKCRCWMEEL